MCLRELREKMLKYDYTIWRYTDGEDEAILLDEGRYAKKRIAFKVAKKVKENIVRENDVIVVRRIPIELPDSEFVDCKEWVIK